jgi:hypothetical protein
MKSKLILALVIAAGLTVGAQAADTRTKDSQAIELKDGTTLTTDTSGLMRHFDKNGRPILMKDGVQMEGKDGTKYLMKDDALWKQLSIKGTLHPNH